MDSDKHILRYCEKGALNQNGDNVYFVIEKNSSEILCYTLKQLHDNFDQQPDTYYDYHPNATTENTFINKVFNIFGIYVDQYVYDQVFNVGYKLIYLYKKELHNITDINNEIMIDQQIYTGIPLTMRAFNTPQQVNESIKRFLPGKSSINSTQHYDNLLYAPPAEQEETHDYEMDIASAIEQPDPTQFVLDATRDPALSELIIDELHFDYLITHGANPSKLEEILINGVVIEQLNLPNAEQKLPRLRSVVFKNNFLNSLHGVPNVQSVMSEHNQIFTLDDIEERSRIEFLIILNSHLRTLDDLSGFNNLQAITITDSGVKTITPDSGVDSLPKLKMIVTNSTVKNQTTTFKVNNSFGKYQTLIKKEN
jgi:hypothetical protein